MSNKCLHYFLNFFVLCTCKRQFTPLKAENYDIICGILQSVVASVEKLGAPPLKEKKPILKSIRL